MAPLKLLIFDDEKIADCKYIMAFLCAFLQVLDINKEDALPKTLCSICCTALNNTFSNAKKIQKFQCTLREKYKVKQVLDGLSNPVFFCKVCQKLTQLKPVDAFL